MFAVAFRQAWRGVLRRPAAGALAMVSLALGLFGAAYMSVLFRDVLLEPLPLPHSSELLVLMLQSDGQLRQWLPGKEFDSLQQSVAGGLQLTAGQYFHLPLSKTGTATRSVRAAWVLPGYFSVLEIPPLLGRRLQPGDSMRDIRPILISESFWKAELGGRQDVLGLRVELHGEESEIVGVMPFRANLVDREVSLWSALPENPQQWRNVFLIARSRELQRSGPMAEALDTVHQSYLERTGDRRYEGRLVVMKLKDALLDGIWRDHEPVRPSVYLLLVLTGALFFMGCTNLANVMLVQVNIRRSEFALRAAVGASHLVLVGQLLLESLFLASLAGGFGIIVGIVAQSYFNRHIPAWLSLQYGLDNLVPDLWTTLGLIVVGAVGCAAIPGWLLSRDRNLAAHVAVGVRGTWQLGTFSRILLVAETSIATVLLIAAVVCAVQHWQLVNTPLGFNPDPILKVDVKYEDHLTWQAAEGAPQGYVKLNPSLRLVNEELLSRISGLPGVVEAARVRSWDCGGAVEYFTPHEQIDFS